YVPLDPSYPSERLAHMLSDSAPVAVLSHGPARAALQSAMAAGAPDAPVIDLVADAPLWAGRPAIPPDIPARGATSGELAYVIYTSGSTGLPKGVMVEHRGVVNLVTAQGEAFDVGPDSRVLQFASFSFDACVWEVFMTLCKGAALCLPAVRGAAGSSL